ncbi:M28 family peptidase [Breznakiella homolactica]|uniref:M28 family peptidase n=2 Tax=Breznakiella homolactica TaxID=2798577 RepID=A0A7T7XS47_9SPIR|nr:M28 family peptidase [Breznakiella homolactica]
MPILELPKFREFIAPGADRFSILKNLLEELGLSHSVIEIEGARHFLVAPPGGSSFQTPGLTVLVSHYDRVQGSPGANDNSAGIFQLLEAAVKLKEDSGGNWMMVFTDKEELNHGQGVRDQGSYTLAAGLKNIGIRGTEFFIFDACGTGDTIIISTTVDYLLKGKDGDGITRTRKEIQRLKSRALECARNISLKNILLMPTPFSDDAGFLSAGLPAQTITVLPQDEASRLASALRTKPHLAEALVNSGTAGRELVPYLPETWKRINGPSDRELFLTPEHYPNTIRFACGLCKGS